MRFIQFNHAPMPDQDDLRFIEGTIVVDHRGGAEETLNANKVCEKAQSINIYFVDEYTMDSVSDTLSKGLVLDESESGCDLPQILFPGTKKGHESDEENLPQDIPQRKIDDEIIASWLRSITYDVNKKWEDAVKNGLDDRLIRVDCLGLYLPSGPINTQKNIHEPEIWICYPKIERESKDRIFKKIDASEKERVIFRTIGVILHELGHAVMDAGCIETAPHSLYTYVEEPLADKIMLDYLDKVRAKSDYRKKVSPIYTFNRECVKAHPDVRYSVGAKLHAIKKTSWTRWKDAKWNLYSKRIYLEKWIRLIGSPIDFEAECESLFNQIVEKSLGYARHPSGTTSELASKVAMRSLVGVGDFESQVNYILGFFENKRYANLGARVLYIAPNECTAIKQYLKFAEKYEAYIQFGGNVVIEGLSLNADFFNNKFIPKDTPKNALPPIFKIIVATPDMISNCIKELNFKAVYIGSQKVRLAAAGGILNINANYCDACIFSFTDSFEYIADRCQNYVVASSNYNLQEELKKNIVLLNDSMQKRYNKKTVDVDQQAFITDFSKMNKFLCYEIKGAIKAIVAIYKVYALTEIHVDSEITKYYDWCERVIGSMRAVAVENHIGCLK